MSFNILFLEHGAKLFGGGNISSLLLIKSLNRKIFNPIIVSGQENLFTQKARELNIKVEIIPINKKLSSLYRNQIKANPFLLLSIAFNLIVSIIKVSIFIKKNNIHIVHPCDNIMRIIGSIAAKVAKINVVCNIHDELDNKIFINRFLRLFFVLMMDRIIVVAERIRGLFKVCGKIPDKIVTIHNGVDLSIFDYRNKNNLIRTELEIPNNNIVIAIIGLLIPLKGHKVLFDAIKTLKQDGLGSISCLVVGSGPLENTLKNYVCENELSDAVFFLGFRDDITNMLKNVDILVMPSFTEAFPRVIIEAMSMGVAVIGSNVGGIPEAIEHGKTGLLVNPGDVQALYNSIKFFYENPDKRSEFAKNGIKKVEELFDIKENVKKVESIYLELVNKHGIENNCPTSVTI